MEILSSILIVIEQNYLLLIAFFFIALVYSSVGFGGGSSYSALLSLTSLPFIQFRAISLLCNITVVSGGTYVFAKNKLYNWKKVLPLVIFSIPFAFFGDFLKIEQRIFYIILGISLVSTALLMLISKKLKVENNIKTKTDFGFLKNALFGGTIGFVSGMVGIGGGVFLAPLLHLTKWDSTKKIAATSSLFILVNSVAGLVGQLQNPEFVININLVVALVLSVLIGGQIGSRLSVKINPISLKRITALLIGFVALRILYLNIFQ